jgi:phosphoenolpyruvate carboxylase
MNHSSPSPLSKDIRFLGDLLGMIIREQQGESAFLLVEQVRAAAKARRSGEEHATQTLIDLISGASLDEKRVLIKAFANYFQLINIAEDQQRIRVLRDREREGKLDDSVENAIRTLQAQGYTGEQVKTLLQRLCVRLVLTAHPSEAKRQEVLIKLRDIADYMAIRERQALLPREETHMIDDIVRRIEQLWHTRPTRANRTTVEDEVDFGQYFITSTLMDVTVDLYTELRAHLNTYYPETDWSKLPRLLQFASWIGGDRDGNPNVTPELTLDTFARNRQRATQAYLQDIEYLRARLTQAEDEIPVSDELKTWILAAGSSPDLKRYQGEIYRQHLKIIADRLASHHYRTGDELLEDLQLISDSLRTNRAQHSAEGTLQRLITKVKLFGLHLVPLDIREDSRHHAAAIGELFEYYRLCQNYAALTESEKQALLTREIDNPRPLFPPNRHFSEITDRVIATWRMVTTAHQRHGKVVIDSYIASMSQHPSDILTMLLFATETGVADDLDIVPLFETVDDLQRAPTVMQTLFDNPMYAAHLAKRGKRQQIMIGYSDSNKDGGYIASNWNLYTAQQNLAELCKANQIQLELFHGRGGSIGRGGGPTNRAMLAQPADSLSGRVKITEQGEVIAYRYSNTEIARRHLHQVMNAAILATGLPSRVEIRPEWRETMRYLSEHSQQAYRSFVYETPGFLTYWQEATPINELASMPIGSRPAKRSKGGFDSIRAIPWVFSWMQSRSIIPSWYGVGHALESFCQTQSDGLERLREMYDQWLFFTSLIDNVQLDVAKADMGIAMLYTELVSDQTLREQIFSEMRAEHDRACQYLCSIARQDDLLAKTPVIKRSIERRNPYVDPLNFIQVDLLRRLRKSAPDAPEYDHLLQAVLSTINGIAAGMKTTG